MVWKNDQVSEEETAEILTCAAEVKGEEVPGDFVEMGCYKGDTALFLANVLNTINPVEKGVENLRKKLWIYDSFEGLPEKSAMDESVLGVDFKRGELAVTKREVKERFLRAGLRVPVITKGWFNELTEADFPEQISLAFLDGDFYESIKDSLRLVENLMADGGKLLVHDYDNPALPGVKKSVDEWLRKSKGWKVERQVKSLLVIQKEKP